MTPHRLWFPEVKQVLEGTGTFVAREILRDYSPLNNCESVISNPSANISTDLRHGSFLPRSKSDKNGLPRPVWTAK
jgi:hypothetical protein